MVFELEDNAETFLGPDPISAAPMVPVDRTIPTGRYGRWLYRMRTRVIPRLFAEANESKVELILTQKISDGRNALSYTNSETAQEINAIITGPSAENLERGFLAVSDLQMMIAADDITVGLSAKHRIKFEAQYYEIKFIRPVPRYPSAVAYILGIAGLSS